MVEKTDSPALPPHPTVKGLGELAKHLAVPVDQVQKWRTRGRRHVPFPEPKWTVCGRAAWDVRAVDRWAEAVGITGSNAQGVTTPPA